MDDAHEQEHTREDIFSSRGRTTHILIDHRVAYISQEVLKNRGITVIGSDDLPFSEPLRGHSDLQVLRIDDCILTYSSISEELRNRIRNLGYELIETDDTPGPYYPHDVHFNAAVSENLIICNRDTVSEEVMKTAAGTGRVLIHVRQGYTRCTTLPLPNDRFLTSDEGIHRILLREGIDSFLVKGDIRLPGHDRGFIGGTSGVLKTEDSTYLLSFGDILSHRDMPEMDEFIRISIPQVEYLNISRESILTDIGSIIIL